MLRTFTCKYNLLFLFTTTNFLAEANFFLFNMKDNTGKRLVLLTVPTDMAIVPSIWLFRAFALVKIAYRPSASLLLLSFRQCFFVLFDVR